MTALLKHHIRAACGHVADTSPYRHHVWAAVTKSYLPCLRQATTLQAGETPNTPYRRFAISVFEQPRQCARELDDASTRVVQISIAEKPVGLITDVAAMGLAAAIMTVLILVYIGVTAGIAVGARFQFRPSPTIENAATS